MQLRKWLGSNNKAYSKYLNSLDHVSLSNLTPMPSRSISDSSRIIVNNHLYHDKLLLISNHMTLVPKNAESIRPAAPPENSRAASVPTTPKDVEEFRQTIGNSNIDIFTYNEMKLTTKNFRPDQILGEGGFGIVYKGVIDENVRPDYKSTMVAVKQLDPEGIQGDREWLVTILSD